MGQDRRVLAVAPDRHVEGDGSVLGRAEGQVEHGPRGKCQLEARGLRRPRHQRLAEDVAQPLPAQAGRDRGQVLAAEDEPHRLDREVGAGGVGGPDQEVADARAGHRGRQRHGVGLHLRAGDHGGRDGAGQHAGQRRLALEVHGRRRAGHDVEVGTGRHAHPDLDGLELVGVLQAGRALDVQDGVVILGPAHEEPVADGEPADARSAFPASRGGKGRDRTSAAGRRSGACGRSTLRCRKSSGGAVEPPFRARDARRLRGRGALDLLGVEPLDEPDRAHPALRRPPAARDGGDPDCCSDHRRDEGSRHALTHAQASDHGDSLQNAVR